MTRSSGDRPAGARNLLLPLLTVAALGLPACSITWRQPEIVPLNPVEFYAVGIEPACDAAAEVFEALGLEVTETMRREQACVLETGYARLDAPDDPFEHLRDVGHVSAADTFLHGRYLLTASIRQTARGNTRVRLTSRVEGYEGSYRTVRSNGTIERVAFERLSERLGTEPLGEES